jgi:hypothetical protein
VRRLGCGPSRILEQIWLPLIWSPAVQVAAQYSFSPIFYTGLRRWSSILFSLPRQRPPPLLPLARSSLPAYLHYSVASTKQEQRCRRSAVANRNWNNWYLEGIIFVHCPSVPTANHPPLFVILCYWISWYWCLELMKSVYKWQPMYIWYICNYFSWNHPRLKHRFWNYNSVNRLAIYTTLFGTKIIHLL